MSRRPTAAVQESFRAISIAASLAFFLPLPLGFCATGKTSGESAEFLYQLATEHRDAGHLEDALHELRKALLIDPNYQPAKDELSHLEALRVKRQEAIDTALYQATRKTVPVQAEVAPPKAAAHPKPKPSHWVSRHSLRIPSQAVNGTRWFYVFGPHGQPKYGALNEPQQFVVHVPQDSQEKVTIRVLDADTRGRHDEMDGDSWDTATRFSVSGKVALDSTVVSPQAPDGSNLTFGPYAPSQGQLQDGQSCFAVKAQGLTGDDNNLFALEVTPSSAQCYALNPSIRLSDEETSRMQFFPYIPEGARQVVVEQNYDLDRDGGHIDLIPTRKDGRKEKPIRMTGSGTGAWATNQVNIPPQTDGTRWTYRITKATQPKGNMSFRMSDTTGKPFPIYVTRGQDSVARPSQEPERIRSCNAFAFDASQSYDPDKGVLTYLWDFGDGTTAEGIRVQHTYQKAGNYAVTLRVKDPSATTCCQAEAKETVAVNLPPHAVIEAPQKSCLNFPLRFSAARSSDSPGETLAYFWDFGDGQKAEGVKADHIYTKGGTYHVVLTVDDTRATPCSKDSAQATVTVNAPPVVQTNGTVKMCALAPAEPLEVVLNAQGSDPNGDTLAYAWDFGDGEKGVGARTTHTYKHGGHYTATVTVDDGSETACSKALGVVAVYLNHPPVAAAEPIRPDCPGSPVTFNGNASSDADGNVLTYQWAFGDGQTATGSSVEHAYALSGTYRGLLTVNDGTGTSCSVSSTPLTAVINAPPVAHITVYPLSEERGR